MDKFIVGEWYEVGNPPERYKNIVKIKQINSNRRIEYKNGSYNTLNSEGYFSGWRDGDGAISDITYSRRLTLEEVQSYLPEGHVDKYSNYEIY